MLLKNGILSVQHYLLFLKDNIYQKTTNNYFFNQLSSFFMLFYANKPIFQVFLKKHLQTFERFIKYCIFSAD